MCKMMEWAELIWAELTAVHMWTIYATTTDALAYNICLLSFTPR
jgi:hypothetical protein